MFERSFLYTPRLVSFTSDSRQIKSKLDVASFCPAVAINSVLNDEEPQTLKFLRGTSKKFVVLRQIPKIFCLVSWAEGVKAPGIPKPHADRDDTQIFHWINYRYDKTDHVVKHNHTNAYFRGTFFSWVTTFSLCPALARAHFSHRVGSEVVNNNFLD